MVFVLSQPLMPSGVQQRRLDYDGGSRGKHQHVNPLRLARYYAYRLNAVIKPRCTDSENCYNYTINEAIETRGFLR